MLRNLITMFVLLLMATGTAWSQASVTAQAFAEVIEALTANETDQLNFGRFSPESNGGQIVITPEGMRTAAGTVVLAAGPQSPGRFMVSGASEAAFSIQLPAGPAVLTHQQSGETMLVEGWVTDPPADSEAVTLPDGSRQINVGATLTVGPADQNPVGIYGGTFLLTFAYN